MEISFGIAEPKKKVSTASEWSSAWRRASKAIAFTFPHHREELLDYGDYIESEFAAKLTSSHHKLILYDIALQNKVGGGQNLVLSDHSKFDRLYSVIVLPDGVEGYSDNSGGRKSNSSKELESWNFATSSMLEPVKTQAKSANMCTLASDVEKQATEKRTVRTALNEIYRLQPKYLRHNLWQEYSTLSPTTAE